ncbi:MAG: polyphosphate:AMP phosphotransferase [Pirellulaceae bacterium]
MFDAVDLGEEVTKGDFEQEEPQLHSQLLELQRRIGATSSAVVIVIAGVEGAGKGEVVNLLMKWFDARGVETNAFWDESDEERERPRYWRFWRALPGRGRIGIVFGSWYTQPIIDHVEQEDAPQALEPEIRRINNFEQALHDDGALIIKLWFHLSKKEQKHRIKSDRKDRKGNVSPLAKKYSKHYDDFARVCERVLRLTDRGACRWYLVGADNRHHRNRLVGRTLVSALEGFLNHPADSPEPSTPDPAPPVYYNSALEAVDLSSTITDDAYDEQLDELQHEIYQLAWRAHERDVSMAAVFEGWDAAGKGGAIRRFIQGMDARLYQVKQFAAPTDEERAHHYLWRFWRQLPRAGYSTIYDRSWYGRVLVERVEGFARPDQWRRAYGEINGFEEQLVEHGVVLLKFWLHIDPDEQLRRFQEREATPWKRHKITEEDWRNRERWDDYRQAVDEMIARTSTVYAPWTLVAGNDKHFARIEVLKTARDALKKAVS